MTHVHSKTLRLAFRYNAFYKSYLAMNSLSWHCCINELQLLHGETLVICSSDEPSQSSHNFRFGPTTHQSLPQLSTHLSNRTIHHEELQLHPHPSHRQRCQHSRVWQVPCQGWQVLQESCTWCQGCQEVSRVIEILWTFPSPHCPTLSRLNCLQFVYGFRAAWIGSWVSRLFCLLCS